MGSIDRCFGARASSPAVARATPRQAPTATGRGYFTFSSTLPEWLLNSGAYMHWTSAMPVW